MFIQIIILIATLALALTITPSRAEFFDLPKISARAALVMNAQTGEILYARQAYQRLPPASTTKVLTTLIALEKLDLNAKVAVSPSAAGVEPSRIGLRSGEALYVQDLLYGLMLKSGNDAAEVAAEAMAGSIPGFAAMMNAKAWELRAHNSHFANPHGLPNKDHYSTVYDLALIFRHAMTNPIFAEIVRTRHAALRIEAGPDNWRMVPVRNSNRLLHTFKGALGGKTGYTRKAKRCFVGAVSRNGTPLIVVVLGSTHRWQDVTRLFEYGFSRIDSATPVRFASSRQAFTESQAQ